MIKLCVSFPILSRKVRDIGSTNPKEFWYGTNQLDKEFQVIYVNSRIPPTNLWYKILLAFEIVLNRITNIGIYKTRVVLNKKSYNSSDIIISFTDAHSLNIGLFIKKKENQKLIGVFHGLSDFNCRIPSLFRKYFERKLIKSLESLNYCLFLGDYDLQTTSKKYPFIREKSNIFKFGVDHKFWKPAKLAENIDIFCVGSDINRDYEILKKISPNIKVKLLTNKKIDIQKNKNIELIKGSFTNSSVSDIQLRNLYNSSKIILIPLKNVYQPSGQSVALQAMSCGKTVIITKTKGLFDKVYLKDNYNIIFVKPNSPKSLNKKIKYLLDKDIQRKNVGKLARKTVIKNFTIKHMSDCLNKVLKKI